MPAACPAASHVIEIMGFRYISKIAVVLGVVLGIVVLLEFALLNLYVKETNANFPEAELPTNRIDGVVDVNDPGNIRLTSTLSPEESRIEEQGKPDETKR